MIIVTYVLDEQIIERFSLEKEEFILPTNGTLIKLIQIDEHHLDKALNKRTSNVYRVKFSQLNVTVLRTRNDEENKVTTRVQHSAVISLESV